MINLTLLIILGLTQLTLQQPTEPVLVKTGKDVDPVRKYPDLLPTDDCGPYVPNRIVGGRNASVMEFPWMALLGYPGLSESEFPCAGTLISARYVLTGRNCVSPKIPNVVRLGEHTIGQDRDCNVNDESDCAPPVKNVDIEYIVRHQHFDQRSKTNDIALIRLAETVEFEDHIKPVCLPVTGELQHQRPDQYIVTGWGRTEFDGAASHALQKATVPAVPDRTVCQREFEGSRVTITDGHICAGESGGADTCHGDSGGPLGNVAQLNGLRFVQYGITSFGRGCGEGPSVYTDVARFMDWIRANMEP